MFALVRRQLLFTRRGIAVAALFGLLVAGVQVESGRHALSHVGEWLRQSHDAGLQLPAELDACALCALFAGGADAVSADPPAPAPFTPDNADIRERTVAPAAYASPSPYRSRAPPSIR